MCGKKNFPIFSFIFSFFSQKNEENRSSGFYIPSPPCPPLHTPHTIFRPAWLEPPWCWRVRAVCRRAPLHTTTSACKGDFVRPACAAPRVCVGPRGGWGCMGGEEKRLGIGGHSVCVGKESVSSIWKWWGCMWSKVLFLLCDYTGGGEDGVCGL